MQIEQLFDFLHRSVSPFHAVHTAAQLLDASGIGAKTLTKIRPWVRV